MSMFPNLRGVERMGHVQCARLEARQKKKSAPVNCSQTRGNELHLAARFRVGRSTVQSRQHLVTTGLLRPGNRRSYERMKGNITFRIAAIAARALQMAVEISLSCLRFCWQQSDQRIRPHPGDQPNPCLLHAWLRTTHATVTSSFYYRWLMLFFRWLVMLISQYVAGSVPLSIHCILALHRFWSTFVSQCSAPKRQYSVFFVVGTTGEVPSFIIDTFACAPT